MPARISLCQRRRVRAKLWSALSAIACVLSMATGARAAEAAPVLLTEPTSTRAIAVEAVNFKRDPFPVTSDIAWTSDRRTRIMLFAMNLGFLAGESANALSADAEDATGRRYPLKVEAVVKVREQEWMHAVVLRLHDEMTDALGDVLVRISLHGLASNRVRVAIGQAGGSIGDDPGAVPAPAPATPPAPTPTPTPDPYTGAASYADTVRFLEQASWGATPAEVSRVQAIGLRAYLNEQFNAPLSSYPVMPLMPDDSNLGCPASSNSDATYSFNSCLRENYSMYRLQRKFFQNAMTEQDQLRQRVAWALHQILVVSGREIDRAAWMSPYLQTLDRNAFGNYRQLLQEITLNPGMGEYLDMRRSTRTNPNENFAREILQLFSVGVDQLNPDGTPRLDAQGNRLPTYTQDDVISFTRVFTGWVFPTAKTFTNTNGVVTGVQNYQDPMVVFLRNGAEANHDTGAKVLFNGVTVPAGQTAAKDLQDALDNIFNHPNVGAFLGKQLIQHLVTSNPSPAYVERVARAFNNDCSGLYPEGCTNTRGNLRAVVTAILLDPEARGDAKTDPSYGRLREPVQLINNLLRAFNARSFDKTTASDGYLAPQASPLDQDVFRPPTVFSYYQPDYEVPGARILAPAFGILSTSTALRRANFVDTIVFRGITRTTPNGNDLGSAPQGTSLDFSNLTAAATDPSALVSALDGLMLHNTMSANMRNQITQTVSAIPSTDAQYQLKRVQTAVYLVATSSQYQVQR